MAEYISREEAIKELREVYEQEYPTANGDFDEYASHDIPYVLRNMPSIYVQPVKRGYWEEVTDYGGWGDTHYRCSVCGDEWYLEDGNPKDNNMNFCPRCGARMNLKDGDEE